MTIFEFNLKNQGNEIAKKVQVNLESSRDSKMTEGVSLEPQGQIQQTLQTQRPVNWMTYFVRYQDINGYPFSVPGIWLSPDLEKRKNIDLEIESKMEWIDQRFLNWRLNFSNRRNQARNFIPKIILPDELQLKNQIFPLSIDAQGSLEISYEIENTKALPDSRYRIFLVSETENEKTFEFIFQEDLIRVPVSQQWPLTVSNLGLLLIAIFFIFGGWGLYQFWIYPLKNRHPKERP